MIRSIPLLALFIGASAAAETTSYTTVSLLLPWTDQSGQPDIHASVVAVDATATTYVVKCANGLHWDSINGEVECYFSSTQSIIEGPSTAAVGLTFSRTDYFHMTQTTTCSITSKGEEYTCTAKATGSADGLPVDETYVLSGTGFEKLRSPVTITAGAEKLNARSGSSAKGTASSTTSVSVASRTSESVVDSGSETTGTAAATGTGSESAAAATSTSTDNAARPMATQYGVIAGLAALVGGMAMF
ncbi:Fc.00g018680.m01.CDS01 [Cosmosporella sp. VM-42]